jgi:hypothetical protein
VLKQKGIKLGTNGKKLSRYYQKQRHSQDRKVKPFIQKLRREGLTVREITKALTRRKVKNIRGGTNWHISIVHAIMHRNGIV